MGLSMWGRITLCCAFAVGCAKAQPQKPNEAIHAAVSEQVAPAVTTDLCSVDTFDALLQKYVVGGRVDYARFKADTVDLAAFDAYLDRIGRCDVSSIQGLAHYAFWVNAYNAFNIKGVLEAWPIQNIKSIDGFLDKRQWKVGQLSLTLNDMEYKQLIPAHKDARAHFAVVCADLGSVPIARRAYTAQNVESTLEEKAREFVQEPRNLSIDVPRKLVRVSKLFSPEWYEKDFLADARFKGKRAVEYLVPYLDEERAQFLRAGDYKVEYIDWDWSLNAVN